MSKKVEYVTTGGNINITGEDSTITRENGIWEDNIPKRVVCIDKATNKYITVGKEYEIIVSTEKKFRMLNDNGDSFMYHKRLFKSTQPTSRNITLNLKFDTSELQSKLEKAIYHLKELDKVMGEIGEGDIKVKVDR